MVRTFFVLDYDGTYDNEFDDSYGVAPSVYLIPLDKQMEVENCARKASDLFHSRMDSECLGDIFEELLNKQNISFQLVGVLNILFEERQMDYLADYIPRVIV